MRKNLINARRTAGMSQVEVAKKCNISVCTYQRIENGTREPSGRVLCDLEDLFQMPHRELLAQSGEAEDKLRSL